MLAWKELLTLLLISLLVIGIVFLFITFPTSVFAQEAGQLANPFGGATFGTSLVGFINFLLNNIILPIGAVIAVLFIILSGFLFVTARGDEEKLRLAKKTLLWTVIGVAVLLGSVAISTGIQNTICQVAPGTPLCQ